MQQPPFTGGCCISGIGLRFNGLRADTWAMERGVRRSERTQDKIIQAFARAAAAGQMEKAEGWLALAVWSQGVSEKATLAPTR